MVHDVLTDGLQYVGAPVDLFRATAAKYADQAMLDWNLYCQATLRGSQASGGRFNPPGEFGAIYTADDEGTAWQEAVARFAREGVNGFPPDYRMLRIIVTAGRFAPLDTDAARVFWGVGFEALTAENPTLVQERACHDVARAVRHVADYLVSRSARAEGRNVPLFPDRGESTLAAGVGAQSTALPPLHLRQQATEDW